MGGAPCGGQTTALGRGDPTDGERSQSLPVTSAVPTICAPTLVWGMLGEASQITNGLIPDFWHTVDTVATPARSGPMLPGASAARRGGAQHACSCLSGCHPPSRRSCIRLSSTINPRSNLFRHALHHCMPLTVRFKFSTLSCSVRPLSRSAPCSTSLQQQCPPVPSSPL